MEKQAMPNNIVSEDLAEQELKRIFNRRGYDKPTIEYPLQLFMDVLDWHITELKKREDELRSRHITDLAQAVGILQGLGHPNDLLERRYQEAVTQLRQKE